MPNQINLNALRKQALNLPKKSIKTAKNIVKKFKPQMTMQSLEKNFKTLGFLGGKRKTRKQRKTRTNH